MSNFYLFSTDTKIKSCIDCPMLDRSSLGFWCNLLREKTSIKETNRNCPLIPIVRKELSNEKGIKPRGIKK